MTSEIISVYYVYKNVIKYIARTNINWKKLDTLRVLHVMHISLHIIVKFGLQIVMYYASFFTFSKQNSMKTIHPYSITGIESM